VTAALARRLICIAGVAFFAGGNALAAPDVELPLVRANSRGVDVVDGGRLQRGLWTISPETALDIYFARRAAASRKVTFRTDVDSISFDVQPGGQYDFFVLLGGTRCCHTRISTRQEMPRGAGTIPFTFGPDDKIHVVGRINGSQPLDLEVDFGADSLTLFPSGLEKKAAPHVDGQADNFGTGGVVTRAVSNDNRLTVDGMEWPHETVVLIEKQADRADGIIGYTQFDNLVVEIDYDAMVMRVGDVLPARAAAWTRLPLTFIRHLPSVPVRVEAAGEPFDTQLVIDTGSNLSVFLNRESAAGKLSRASLPQLGASRMLGTGNDAVRAEVLRLPGLRLGGQELRDLPVHVELPDSASGLPGHLGMDVLKRFNTVLDLRDDVAYFAPSRLMAVPYRENYRTGRAWKWLAAGLVLAVLAGLFRWWRRARSLQKRGGSGV
jgi:hypothetical protein